jgi:hypothetical protein
VEKGEVGNEKGLCKRSQKKCVVVLFKRSVSSLKFTFEGSICRGA